MTEPEVQVRRGAERVHTSTDWLDSAHSFAFGHAYDPANLGFGPLLAHNEDVIAASSGYDLHRHRDTEILTWVLDGELTHRDESGLQAVVRPGTVQWLSAGSGISHSERNDGDRPLHLIQMWLTPDAAGAAPGHRLLDVGGRLGSGALEVIASGRAEHRALDVLGLRQSAAALWVGRLRPGGSVELPAGDRLHVFLARGSAMLAGGASPGLELNAGDAVRVSAAAGRTARGLRLTATGSSLTATGSSLTATGPAEVLLWQFGPAAL